MVVHTVSRPRRQRLSWWFAAFGLVTLFVLGSSWLRRAAPATPREPPRPPAEYVENGVCLGCHQEEARQWRDSHHAKAMAPPSAKTVRGDFRTPDLHRSRRHARFFKRGDAFFVNIEGEDGKPSDFEIKYTFGLEPLQQYLIEMPGGSLQPLTIAWDGPKKKWFHLFPTKRRRRATCCTGPGAIRPRTRCASSATPPTTKSATTPRPTPSRRAGRSPTFRARLVTDRETVTSNARRRCAAREHRFPRPRANRMP